MNLLDKLGLGSKSHPKAPLMGEQKRKKEEESSVQNNPYLRVLIIIIFLAILCLSVPKLSFRQTTNYTISTPWKKENLTAPFTFPILKSDKEIRKEKKAIKQNTNPIYDYDNHTLSRSENKLDSLFYSIQPVLLAYQQWQQAKAGNSKSAAKDSLDVVQQKAAANVAFSDVEWAALVKKSKLKNIQPHPAGAAKRSSFNAIGPGLYQNLKQILADVLHDGVINKPKEQLSHNKITVLNAQRHTEQTFGTATVRDVQEADQYARYRLSKLYNGGVEQAGLTLFNQIIEPNFTYNAEQTKAAVDKALASVSKTKGAITKGQVIIRKGDLITQQKYQELESLAKARSQFDGSAKHWLQYAGEVIAIFSIITIFFFYLYLYRKYIFFHNAKLLLVLLTLIIIIVASSLLFRFTSISLFIIPVAIAPIILTIIFDSRVGILAAITLALIIGFINGGNFIFVTATIVGCCLGLFSVRDIKKRSQFFFITPGIVFISYIVVVVGYILAASKGWHSFLDDLAFIVINSLFIVFTYPFILLFEKAFNITTDLTLIELSDTNLPLLKRLMNEAPGTFHHSLQVANLAEAAAGNIEANSLLCRVGALYHDIGKLENPGYFTENQRGGNEHDNLKPRMSALVIKAHVSNGVKMARKNKLPDAITDFIKTHHGTTVIRYFYDKAKENSDPDKNEIQKDDFRYDGPIPQTMETGIVMLADGVEAASRAMKDPNYQKLDNLINKLVDRRLNEGQLNQTPLTFQDISIIKNTFLNILVGIYHSRVEYPDDEEDETPRKEAKKEQPEKKEKALKPAQKGKKQGSKQSADFYYNS
jgi:putative nucleotidyltransferase with HDIG domain